MEVGVLGNVEAREQRKIMVALLPDGFPLPAPVFHEILQVIKWASIICSKMPETHGKTPLAQIGQAEESPPSFDSSMCLSKWPLGTGIQRHIQRCLFNQWYVENAVPHLQDPEILLKYPCIHHWASLTFTWSTSDKQKFCNIWMEGSEYNVNLLFEELQINPSVKIIYWFGNAQH